MRLFSLDNVVSRVNMTDTSAVYGKVAKAVGMVIEGFAPGAKVGSLCRIVTGENTALQAEVVGFRGHTALLMPLGDIRGVDMNSIIEVQHTETSQPVGDGLLGRVIDGMGRPIDGLGDLNAHESVPIYVILRTRWNATPSANRFHWASAP